MNLKRTIGRAFLALARHRAEEVSRVSSDKSKGLIRWAGFAERR